MTGQSKVIKTLLYMTSNMILVDVHIYHQGIFFLKDTTNILFCN